VHFIDRRKRGGRGGPPPPPPRHTTTTSPEVASAASDFLVAPQALPRRKGVECRSWFAVVAVWEGNFSRGMDFNLSFLSILSLCHGLFPSLDQMQNLIFRVDVLIAQASCGL
jgi:hypothetical protein